jgi:tetraacyldisaccharide 4'-kinase
MRPPEFWLSGGPLARALDPIGRLYGAVTAWRLKHTKPDRVSVPVISVGNLTVGGTGKTPVVRDLIKRLKDLGHRPAVVLRGYGGRSKGPLRVDVDRHTALDVGDEALLHARDGTTWIARNRARGAQAAVADGATIIVLDDAHQHPSLTKDLALVVVDGATGFGNHRILPAGPLREDVRAGLARADGVVIMGQDDTDVAGRLPPSLPALSGRLEAEAEALHLRGRKVVAFAGLGRPEKFFNTLVGLGAVVVATHRFDDHHLFQPADIQTILDEAFALDAMPVTTEKDAMRLTPDQRQQVNVLRVAVRWQNPAALDALVQRVLSGR